MKTLMKFIVATVALAYYVGCADVKFTKVAGTDPCSANPGSCVVTPTSYDWDYIVPISGGLVDILFVNDNSGSMSFEQNRMADRFDSFLTNLDNQGINYRIGVITSDISTAVTKNPAISFDANYPNSITRDNDPRGINGNGALQDGKLITIPATGQPFLSSTEGTALDRRNRFASVIKRNETLACETFLKQYPVGGAAPSDASVRANCPSGDERGMFAANLFVRNNPSSFIRPNAGFAIVFLADEDERSGLWKTTSSNPLQKFDLPQTLVAKLRTDFLNKPVKVHSIITKDTSCLSAQSNQINTVNGISGSIGEVYRMASESTGGIVGDICASDYGSQLSSISNDIVDMSQDISLKCATPANLQVSFSPSQPNLSYNVIGATLTFSQRVSPGVQVRLKYTCPQD